MSNPYTYYSESGAEYFVNCYLTIYGKGPYYCIMVGYPGRTKKTRIDRSGFLSAEEAQAALDEMADKRGWRKGI